MGTGRDVKSTGNESQLQKVCVSILIVETADLKMLCVCSVQIGLSLALLAHGTMDTKCSSPTVTNDVIAENGKASEIRCTTNDVEPSVMTDALTRALERVLMCLHLFFNVVGEPFKTGKRRLHTFL